MASTVNMRPGLRAMGLLHPEGRASDEPVALETAVIATGARPGNGGSKRELFTEETQTVLVFEKGAVIRLSAGVADGQLLFLTNKKTGREVVTQVVRKRSFRPTSCYVDLEFTEASPGFWGIDFSKSAPAIPCQVATDVSEDESSEAVRHAAPPDLKEVARLKNEVAELQTKLKTLTGNNEEGSVAPSPVATGSDALTSESATQQREEKALAELLAQETQQDQIQAPKRLVAYPKKSASSVVKAVSKLATAGAFAAVLVAAAIAVYRFGLLDSFITKSAVANSAPNPGATNMNSVAKPATSTSNATSAPANAISPVTSAPLAANLASKTGAQTESPTVTVNSMPAGVDAVVGSRAANSTARESKRHTEPVASTFLSAARSGNTPSSSSSAPVAESGSVAAKEDYVAARLIYSVKPVSPSEALRNYVTGNVNVDALVDVTGHVKSVTVISGPEKLRNQAIAEMKQYIYEPARKSGKPVASHVQTSLKYWYEP